MTAPEIVARLKDGETVIIPASYAFVFMLECERHEISSAAISMTVSDGKCTMKIRDKHQATCQHGASPERP